LLVLTFRHRSAEAELDRSWEFDPARALVMLTHRTPGASAPRLYDIPVCGARSPRHGRFVMTRLGDGRFRVHPTLMLLELMPGDRRWLAEDAPVHPRFPRATPCDLTGAPASISAEMIDLLAQ
jgi:hypothetical protein